MDLLPFPGPSPNFSPRRWTDGRESLRPWRAASVHSMMTNVRSVLVGVDVEETS